MTFFVLYFHLLFFLDFSTLLTMDLNNLLMVPQNDWFKSSDLFFPFREHQARNLLLLQIHFLEKYLLSSLILFFLGLAFGLCHRSSWLGKFPYQLAQSNASLTQYLCLSSGFLKNL